MRSQRSVRRFRQSSRQQAVHPRSRQQSERVGVVSQASATIAGLTYAQWRWLLLAAVVWVCSVASAFAQLPQTRIYALFPPGGQVGTTVDLTITRGDDLDELSKLTFSHPGITAAQKMADGPNGQKVPVANQFTVTIAGNVPPGHYEVRGVGLFGISNPRTFVVGKRAEAIEVEPNNTREQATPAVLGQSINGRITGATDVDFFKFTATPGQRIIADCVAQRIDSRLDATLELQDITGRRLAAARNSQERDAILDYVITEPGEYFLRLTDFIYAGSEDYFYRLTIHASAHLDFIIPPAGVPGTTSQYTLYGRNLPNGQPTDVVLNGQKLQKTVVSIALPADATLWPQGMKLEPYAAGADGFPFALTTAEGLSNSLMIGLVDQPVTLEVEPNDQPAQAQKISIPAAIAGQFQTRGDTDFFQFEAKGGEVFWIDVRGQRLGTGADPYLTLDQVTVNDQGVESLRRIAAVDDDATNPLPIQFEVQHDDPVYKFAVPADGTYRIAMRDRYGASRGAPSLQYVMSIRRETPDFRVVVLPDSPTPPNQKLQQTWSLGLRRGDQGAAAVVVLRQDGFEGDVDIAVHGLPAGVTCREISIGSKPSSGMLVFQTAENAAPWAGTVQIVGKARIAAPDDMKAESAARAAIKPATDAVAAAETALTKPSADLKAAEEALNAAKQELAAKPDDEGLKKKVADAEAKVAAAKTANDAAVAAKAAADQKLAEARAALTAAEAKTKANTKEVVRTGRSATVVWNGAANMPGQARLSQGLELSVNAEAAPFQVSTDVHRVIANHGRQILIPVQAVRREGFDADIALTFVGQPQNLQIENKPVKKGAGEELYRVYVPPNVPVGTYVMYLSAQAQVPYRRNPEKVDRLKVEFDAADKAAADAVTQQKAATTKRDEAVKAAAAEQQALKAATDAKAAAEKTLATAQAAEKAAAEAASKAAEDAKAAADQKLAEAQAAVKTATEALAAAEKARVEAEAKAKGADEAKVAAEAEFKQADDSVKATTAAKAAADKAYKDADTAAKPKNTNFLPPTTPIVLTVKPAPYTLTATPANGGRLKRGETVEVKVAVKRQNDFAGPVTLTIDHPKAISGVTAAPVTIPADQSEGTLVIAANGEATEGALANLVVRAVSQFEGEAMVDQPVTINVAK